MCREKIWSCSVSYRPISNLSVVSKLLERIVTCQLMAYLSTANLLPTLQSVFRSDHSTETAVLQVMLELLQVVDRGEVGALNLLDLTAAFDTVDHDILLQRMQQTFGIDGNAHRWFRSYLVGRTRYVNRGALQSLITRLLCGVPQGSVLGPLLFILYTFNLIQLIEGNGLGSDLYDTQVSGSCHPSNVRVFSSLISDCLRDVASWMKSNRLKLNSSKTEVMWCATSRRQHLLPASAISVDGVMVVMAITRRCWISVLSASGRIGGVILHFGLW